MQPDNTTGASSRLIPLHRLPHKRAPRSLAIVIGYALCSECDYADFASRFWYRDRQGYAATSIKGRARLMQHFILPKKKGLDVAHENSNKLDNRRWNLDYNTHSRNHLNRNDGLLKSNTSGFRGVTFRQNKTGTRVKPWRARFTVRGRDYEAGYFATAEGAHCALEALIASIGPDTDTLPLGPKGDCLRGAARHGSKLTDEAVLDLLRLRGAMSRPKLSAMFGIRPGTVQKILENRSWKHIPR